MGGIQIIEGNCMEHMQSLPDNDIDLVVTDPPYGISYRSARTRSREITWDKDTVWSKEFFELLAAKVKIGSHIYCFTDFEYSSDFIEAMKPFWKIRNLLCIPRKKNGNGGSRIFQQRFEFCIFATRGDKDHGRFFNQTRIVKTTKEYQRDKRYGQREWAYRLPDHWYWTTASLFEKHRSHPTEKNVECLRYMIQLSSDPGDKVIDPFMGVGSTALACIREGRRFWGCEIDPEYYKKAEEHILMEKKEGDPKVF